MIYGIGLDIVDVRRIRSAWRRFGERLARRLLHREELLEYAACRRPEYYLAKRLAAKEALVKALGTGFRDGIVASQLLLTHLSSGQPQLHCQGIAGKLLLERGITERHVSITDEKHYVLACVVLARGRRRD